MCCTHPFADGCSIWKKKQTSCDFKNPVSVIFYNNKFAFIMFLVFWCLIEMFECRHGRSLLPLNICSCRENRIKKITIIELQLIEMWEKEFYPSKWLWIKVQCTWNFIPVHWPTQQTAVHWPTQQTAGHWPTQQRAVHWPTQQTAVHWPTQQTAVHCPTQQTAVHWPTQPSFKLHTVQDIPQRRHFQSQDSCPYFCLVKLWGVCVLPSSAAHKNQHSVVVLCTIMCKMQAVALFLCLSSPNTEDTFSFVVAVSIIVTSSGSGAKLLKHGSFGRNF